MASLEEHLKTHMEADGKFQEEVGGDIKVIKENHLAHIQTDIAILKTNVDWLMKYHWLIASSSIGALVTGVWNVFR